MTFIATGRATIRGIATALAGSATNVAPTTPVSISGYIGIPENVKISHKAKMSENVDGQGFDTQLGWVNQYLEGTFEFQPAAPSGTNTFTAAKSQGVIIGPGSTVAITGIDCGPQGSTPGTPVTASPDYGYNGTWLYVGDASITLKAGENATMSLPLRKYVDKTQNTALTTLISS